MERHFHEQLGGLKKRLMHMSALAESMIVDALSVLAQRDASRLENIRRMEAEVNLMQVEVDETCFTLIALNQPAATDLRFILAAIKTNSDLERLADEAINISNKAERLLREPVPKEIVILPRMADIARGMVKDSLDAFIGLNTALAREVLLRDDDVDRMKAEVTEELVADIARDPGSTKRSMALILAARNIERIADHATNIAENAIFVAEGRDVRHRSAI